MVSGGAGVEQDRPISMSGPDQPQAGSVECPPPVRGGVTSRPGRNPRSPARTVEWDPSENAWTDKSWLSSPLTRTLRGAWSYDSEEEADIAAHVVAGMLNDGDLPARSTTEDLDLCVDLATAGAAQGINYYRHQRFGAVPGRRDRHRPDPLLPGLRQHPAGVLAAAVMRAWGLQHRCETEWGSPAGSAARANPDEVLTDLVSLNPYRPPTAQMGRRPQTLEWLLYDGLWLGEDGRMMERAERGCGLFGLLAHAAPGSKGMGWLAMHLVGLDPPPSASTVDKAAEALRVCGPDPMRISHLVLHHQRARQCAEAAEDNGYQGVPM